MKTPLATSILALLSSVALAADADTPPPKPGANEAGAKPAPNGAVNVGGKATITIDVNGQKVTREVDLGNATQIKLDDLTGKGAQIKIGAALPAKSVTEKRTTSETRTWLGVSVGLLSEEVRAQVPVPNGTGLVAMEVAPDSPAAKAGLEKNDILSKLDDQVLIDPGQLRMLVGLKKDGDTVHVSYVRKGQEGAVDVKLATHTEDITLSTSVMLNTVAMPFLKKIIGAGAGADGSSNAEPVIIQRGAAVDKDGNLFFTNRAQPIPGNPGEQWHLFVKGAHADVTEAIQQLEKTLREAGVPEEAIAKTRQSVAEIVAHIEKSVREAAGPKDEIQRRTREALEEALRGINKAWSPEDGEASKQPLPALPLKQP